MLLWLEANLVSILLSALLITAVALIIRGLIRDRKAGKHICGGSCGSCSGCGGGCAGCPMQGRCHGT